ncbi:MAG: cytochrome P450 [Acidimicrobiales bacterium]
MATTLTERFDEILKGGPGDLSGFYRDARADGGIFWSDAFGGWVASRYDDVSRVLNDEEYFGPLMAGSGSSIIHGRTILHMEGVEHRRKSAILSKYLRSPRLLEGPQREFVRKLSVELLDALPDGPVDLKPAFTTPLPLQVTAWIMDIEEAPDFRETYDRIVAGGASNLSGDPEVHRRALEARTKLFDFVTPLIAQRRENPGEDLLSTLCATEYEGETLSDDEIRSFCSFLLAAGVETTDRSMSSLLKKLFSEPELWSRLQADRSLIPSACAEGLRWAPPVHAISRGVRTETELSGQMVEPDQRVVVLLASANRDEDHWDDPDDFVLDRFAESADRQFSAKAQILSFGHGRHLCTGSLLARLEMLEGLEFLLDRYDGATFPNGVPDDLGYVLRSPEHLTVQLQPTS